MTKTFRRLSRYSTITLLLVALSVLPAGAAGSWSTLSTYGCDKAISVDGDRLALANDPWGGPTEHLYYGKTNKTKLTDTGIADVNVPVIKGDNIVFSGSTRGSNSGTYFVYNIETGQLIQTGVTTAKTSIHDRRFFNGTYIAYVDSVDSHLKLYSIQNNQVTDTGIVTQTDIYGEYSRRTIDGNIVALRNASDQVGYYNIATGNTTYFDSGAVNSWRNPIMVTGNLISYIGNGGELKYYTISDGQVHGTGIMNTWLQANDGSRIAYTVNQSTPNETVKIFDPATGGVQDSGQYVCNYDGCWLEFSGGKVYSELYEGGTYDTSGSLVYPPEDYIQDGYTACVHAMTAVQ